MQKMAVYLVSPILASSARAPSVAPEKARIWAKVVEAAMMKKIIVVTTAVPLRHEISVVKRSER